MLTTFVLRLDLLSFFTATRGVTAGDAKSFLLGINKTKMTPNTPIIPASQIFGSLLATMTQPPSITVWPRPLFLHSNVGYSEYFRPIVRNKMWDLQRISSQYKRLAS